MLSCVKYYASVHFLKQRPWQAGLRPYPFLAVHQLPQEERVDGLHGRQIEVHYPYRKALLEACPRLMCGQHQDVAVTG